MAKLTLLLAFIIVAISAKSFAQYGPYAPHNPYKEYYEQKLKEDAAREYKNREDNYESSSSDTEHEYYGDLDKDRPEVISFGEAPKPTEVIICGYGNKRQYDCKKISK